MIRALFSDGSLRPRSNVPDGFISYRVLDGREERDRVEYLYEGARHQWQRPVHIYVPRPCFDFAFREYRQAGILLPFFLMLMK